MAHPGPDNLTITVTLPRSALEPTLDLLMKVAPHARNTDRKGTADFIDHILTKLRFAEEKARTLDKLGRPPRYPQRKDTPHG